MLDSEFLVAPSSWRSHAPAKAAGTDPSESHPTNARFTVRCARCTAAPTGFIRTAATRSLEIAVDGLMPNTMMSIGVISAPPPAPVMPTSSPTMALPIAMYGLISMFHTLIYRSDRNNNFFAIAHRLCGS
jgi:hypothetical protein